MQILLQIGTAQARMDQTNNRLYIGRDPQAYLHTTPWLPRKQFLSFLEEMDIYLDCPAFSGYTTAWQALHCGLPIVTLEGQYLRQRLAAGLLRQVGTTDGIARSQSPTSR